MQNQVEEDEGPRWSASILLLLLGPVMVILALLSLREGSDSKPRLPQLQGLFVDGDGIRELNTSGWRTYAFNEGTAEIKSRSTPLLSNGTTNRATPEGAIGNTAGAAPLTISGYESPPGALAKFAFANLLSPKETLCNALTPITAMVMTIPSHHEERDFIRSFVLEMTAGTVKPFFPLGSSWKDMTDESKFKVQKEAEKFDDILLAEYTDSYKHLPAKVLSGLRFVHGCEPKHTVLLLKLDFDVIVNWHHLVPALRGQMVDGFPSSGANQVRNAFKDVIWEGYKWTSMPVIKDPASRNFEDVPFDTFPEYVAGPAYLMNAVFIDIILASRAEDDHIYTNEDAMIGILASRRNITPIHNPRFIVYGGGYLQDTCGKKVQSLTGCDCAKWFTYHAGKGQEWESGIEAARNCAPP